MEANRAPDVISVRLDGQILITPYDSLRLTKVRAEVARAILHNPYGFRSVKELALVLGKRPNTVSWALTLLRQDLRKIGLAIHKGRICSDNQQICNLAPTVEPSCRLRLICDACLMVKLVKPTADPPYCCGQRMLIAGHPKVDRFGLRFKGAIVDPVDNLCRRKSNKEAA